MPEDVAEKPLVHRPAGRVILIDDRDRVLLFHFRDPRRDGAWWITPGGGLKPGENFEQGAGRELREETGLSCDLGPCVWTRRYTLDDGDRRVDMDQRFYVVRCTSFEPSRDGWEEDEHAMLQGHRWWTVGEIAASPELFSPRRIAALLPPIIAGDYPARPIETGI